MYAWVCVKRTPGPIKPLDGTTNQYLITADPGIREIIGEYTVEYRIRVVYFDCPGYADPDNPCPSSLSPGTVWVHEVKFTMSGETWTAAGPVQLQAFPTPVQAGTNPHASPEGWIFVGWYAGLGNTSSSQAFLNSFVLTGPITLYPRFVRARRVQINSNPSGLFVVADRTTVQTPHTVDWGRGTTHTLGVTRDQLDNRGKLWVFESWSDGGAESHPYTVPAEGNSPSPIQVTANFVRGVEVRFTTSPAGLRLDVDSGFNRQNVLYKWAAGSQHTVVAPLAQRDALGRNWMFKSWSNGGSATQTITVPAKAVDVGLLFTAIYDPEARLEIQSSAPGVIFQVDGQPCAGPCKINREVGETVRVSAPLAVPAGDASRLDFAGWSDSGEAERVVTLTADPVAMVANYQLRHRLTVAAEPADGVRFRVQPESADGFYSATAQVHVSVDVRPGYRFLNWDGDATGSARQVVVTMTAPRALRAVLDRVPYLASDSVKNAAGDTPVAAVAAGSIASVYGLNLAAALERGPEFPLAQTLGGVTVRLGDRFLPLFFVSPEQINMQLPSDLADGLYKLTVRREGKPETSTQFAVVRNAPGLFYRATESGPYGLVLHENGQPVTSDSPARRGESVTVLGTGFGPYLVAPPDGFPAPESDNFRLADAVEVYLGQARVEPLYAGAAAGRIGMTAVRFRLGDEIPAGTLELKARVNERDSNTVLLPVE